MFSRRIEIKSPAQIARMREAGLVVAAVLAETSKAAVPGVTTADLDEVARAVIADHGATSNFLGYHGFTGVICTSVNDEVVHGIPGSRVLQNGDLLSIDAGAVIAGWHGDAAVTVPVGAVKPAALELSRVTEDSLWAGIAAARLGGRVGDVSAAIEAHVRDIGGYGIVEGFTGHGIGSAMHMEPSVPNEGKRGRGPKIVKGMAIAIEPMISTGSAQTDILDDGWTAVTVDGSWAAHWEHTVTVTDRGVWVLTEPDGGAERLGRLGVPCGAPNNA